MVGLPSGIRGEGGSWGEAPAGSSTEQSPPSNLQEAMLHCASQTPSRSTMRSHTAEQACPSADLIHPVAWLPRSGTLPMRDANAEASNRDTAGSANANCSMCSILALLWSGPKRVGAELTGSSLKQAIPCTDSTITQNSNIQYRRLCMSAAMRSQKRGLDGAKMALSGQ
eukprot:2268958-Prymnesium_polylepis.1